MNTRHIIYNLARYAANITISGMKACIIRVRGFFQVEMTDKGLKLGLWGLEFSSNLLSGNVFALPY